MKVPVLFLGTRFTGAPDSVPAVVLVAVCAAVLSALSGCAPWFGNRKGSAREMSLSEMAAHGDVAALARMGSLRSARLPSGQREIRVWFVMATGAPDILVRVAGSGDRRRATGEIWAWWSLPSGDGDRRLAAEREDANDRIRDSIRAVWRCSSLETAGGNEACRLQLRTDPNWNVVLAQLDSLRAFTLPDQDSIPPAENVVRAATERRPSENLMVTVEVLDGAVYRTYSYSNPRSLPSTEAQRAAAIVEMVTGLARRARRFPPATNSTTP